MIEKRNRIARAIAEADHLGPEDFDSAAYSERIEYYRMALAALNSAHVYAVHTVASPETFAALGMMTSAMTITIDNDSYVEWGEKAGPGQALHVLVGVDTLDAVEDVTRALSMHNCPVTVTEHADWEMEDEDYSVKPIYTWADWMRDNESQ